MHDAPVIRRLGPDDLPLMEALMACFGEAFGDGTPTLATGQALPTSAGSWAAIPSSRSRR